METKGDLPIIPFATVAALEEWFEKNHAKSLGLWIKFGKKANPAPSVTYAEARDVALCFGWIDGQKASYDADWYLHRFTARRPKSIWSQVNREVVANLTQEGRMRPAGIAAVDAARADGRWDAAYASQSKIEVPDDLKKALSKNAAARKAFEGLSSVNRYAMLFRITTVKRAETRERKIREYVEMLARGETIHPVGPAKRSPAKKLPTKKPDILDGWPKGMSRPSVRALNSAGYQQLDDLRGVDLDTLKDLHGMGPEGLGVLQQALGSS